MEKYMFINPMGKVMWINLEQIKVITIEPKKSVHGDDTALITLDDNDTLLVSQEQATDLYKYLQEV